MIGQSALGWAALWDGGEPLYSTSFWESKRNRERLAHLAVHGILIIGGFLVLVPLVWQVLSSLKDVGQIFLFPPRWIPNPVRWSNYVGIFELMPFGLYAFNSTFITVSNIIGYMLSCTIVAYAFARLRARGKAVLFVLVLSTMMLPQQVVMVPLFVLFRLLGWIDTFKPLIVPSFFGNAFLIFMLRQFFMTIPRDLDDAAKMDGCGVLGILRHVILPLSGPALATVAIFGFLWHWNDFLFPLIFLSSEENKTLQLGLAGVLRQVYGDGVGRWDLLMAASTVVMLPPLLLFVFAQRYFLEGIAVTGLKG